MKKANINMILSQIREVLKYIKAEKDNDNIDDLLWTIINELSMLRVQLLNDRTHN